VIEESAQRCTRITRSLLSFSRASKEISKEISINDMIEKVLVLIEHELGLQNISIIKNLGSDLPFISGEPQLIQQVVFDLIANAKWAIQKKVIQAGGTVTLKTFYDTKKNSVCFSVSDTGIGISKENLEKIFEPFFTTKSVGEGTGLGLSVVYNIVKEHKGTIEVDSELGQWTIFIVYLPVASN
jgi:two-component system, NtrC family, sensor kinase